ncbi:stalk domain-containing protein [Paenibacillus glycanilyticus]|uniref:stalk domain-containing protein n=1 Tax=Paenibacillus glycanilyticus TaxID=126569 RepID=UPI00203E76E2|nr:stalk domain-containing protein [Paenibacillus glycanilyticus]MCM3629408.1 stalk domain-containing protein [Paenibacillus glycanilyticus]
MAIMALIILAGTAYGGSRAAAASGEPDPYQIVALGDSLTAGYEHGYTEKSVPYGYVEHVYEQALFHGLRAEYVNYGILGLKSEGLKLLLQAASDGRAVKPDDIQKELQDPRKDNLVGQTAQMAKSIRSADLIVLTIGGNDLTPVMNMLLAGASNEEITTYIQTILDQYEKDLESSIRTIAGLNSKAHIVIADQYSPIPLPVLQDGVTKLRVKLDQVSARLAKDGIKLQVTDVSSLFVGHELEYTSIAEKDIHPNHLGYAAMGRAFATTVWGDYRTVRPRQANVQMSVVVNGKELPAGSAPPVLRSNRSFVAMRDITDAIGAKLSWNNASQSATVTHGSHKVIFAIGSAYVTIDGKKVKLTTPPAFLLKTGKETKTYLPLAALSEALGLQVNYRSTLQTAFINE